MPDISLVVPTRNRPEELAAALRSISQQDCGLSIETIVVNDAGVDVGPVVDQARAHGLQARVLELSTRAGGAVARNVGLECAQGDLVGFLDDDDLLFPSHLRVAVEALSTAPTPAVYTSCLVSQVRVEDPQQVDPTFVFDIDFDPHLIEVLNFLPIHSVLLPRGTSRFDEAIDWLHDWHFWLRVVRDDGVTMTHVAEPTCVYHRLDAPSRTSGIAHDPAVRNAFGDQTRRFWRSFPPSTPRVRRFRGALAAGYLGAASLGAELSVDFFQASLAVVANAWHAGDHDRELADRIRALAVTGVPGAHRVMQAAT